MLKQKIGTSNLATQPPPVLPVLPEYDPALPTYLVNLPNVVMKEISKFLDYKSILHLRKTCHSIRDSIDHLKPDLHFTSIHFQLTSTSVFIELFYPGETYGKCLPIFYIKTENGCKIQCGQNKKILENEDFVEMALKDYELLLAYQNCTVDWFKLNLEYFHMNPLADTKTLEPVAQKVLERTQNILARRNRPLKVKNFRMVIIRQEQAVEILKLIDPKTLKLVSIHGKALNPMIQMKCDELEMLEQWKKADELEIWRFDFVSPIEKLKNESVFPENHDGKRFGD